MERVLWRTLAAGFCTAFCFLSLARVADAGGAGGLDASLLGLLSDTAPSWLLAAMDVLTYAGSALVLIPLSSFLSFLLWRRGQRLHAAMFFLACLFVVALSNIAKIALSLPRPPDPLGIARGYGYPSGHTALAVVFYGMGACYLRKRGWHPRVCFWMAFLIVIIVALSRIVLRVHYPSDILGGALLGGALLSYVCSRQHVS